MGPSGGFGKMHNLVNGKRTICTNNGSVAPKQGDFCMNGAIAWIIWRNISVGSAT
jgi:hypothetical protein